MSRDLAELAVRIRACRLCVEAPVGPPLPHAPRPILQESSTAAILITGQAPGARVHASGRPFTDPSGVRLRQWLGVGEDVFYDSTRIAIVPMGFCFPGLDATGSDRPPRRECALRWRRELLAAMPQVSLVLAIGQYAQSWHLGPGVGVSVRVENWRAGLDRYPSVFPLPHPSWRNTGWLKKNPWFARELLPDLQKLVRRHLSRSEAVPVQE